MNGRALSARLRREEHTLFVSAMPGGTGKSK